MDGTQIETAIICKKKKANGTAIILFVFAKKSAEASMTSMAVFKD